MFDEHIFRNLQIQELEILFGKKVILSPKSHPSHLPEEASSIK